MEMKRNDPPGRSNRKLRGYLSEITELHREGYTIAGICKVLCDAGIVIGWSTVQREVARLNKSPATTTTNTPQASPIDATPGTESVLPVQQKPATQADVERFFSTHISNPLLKKAGSKP